MQPRRKSVLIPLPRYGFDPTEAGVPWKYFKAAGHPVIFATPNGIRAQADVRMVTGQDLGIFKSVLMANRDGRRAFEELESSPEFQNPMAYEHVRAEEIDALFLPGGHDPGMREYLESEILQRLIVEFFVQKKCVGAICHGTLLVGRSISSVSGKSVLWGRKTTGLTKPQELTAFCLTRVFLGDYYRTYPQIAMEDELRGYLMSADDFSRGPGFPIPTARDSAENPDAGYTVLDGCYLSARWPGDAHRMGRDFVELLAGS